MGALDALKLRKAVLSAQLKLAELALLVGAGKDEPDPDDPGPCAWLTPGQDRYGKKTAENRKRKAFERHKDFSDAHLAWMNGGPGGKTQGESQPLMYRNRAGQGPRFFGPDDL